MSEHVPLKGNIKVLVREWIIETPNGQENLVDHHCTVAFMNALDFNLDDDCLAVHTYDAVHIIPMSNILHIQIQRIPDIQDAVDRDLEDDFK